MRATEAAAIDPGQTPVIHATALSRRFGALEAVRELNIEVARGEVFGFIGPNGAGKSTTIRMLVGLLEPSGGTCEVLGLHLPRQSELLRRHVGYMTQRFSLYDDLTVLENLRFAAEIFGLDRRRAKERVTHCIQRYDLEERVQQRPSQLSGGWRQRLALAAATVHEPELLVLDEPTAGVDPDSRRLFWEQIFDLANRGATVLVSTHYMDEAARCHRLCVMRDGRRVALAQPDRLMEVMESRVFEIQTTAAPAVVEVLRAHPAVLSTTQLGRLIHILLHPGHSVTTTMDEVVAAVRKVDPGATGLNNEAHLEDAMIALTRGESLDIAGDAR